MGPLATCPDRPQWQSLLSDDLPAAERELLTQHLETCSACQELVDRTEPADEMVRLARALGDPTQSPADPTLSQALDRFLSGQHMAAAPTEYEAADLFFLSPAERPDILGRLGAYDVLEVIGQGGMGLVLKAFDPALNRHVALKLIAPAVAGSAHARRRFTREAKAAAAVSHDQIVAVHGVSESAGLPYIVMQYVAGESLQARLDRLGPLPVREILRIGLETAEGLAAAHAQGLIHRDIKPANLLLEAGLEKVKITDFGLARMVDDTGLTQNGTLTGTPEYMAPEQARGGPVDHRADLFSLGGVLYAMATGVSPFRAATTLEVLRRVCEETPTPPDTLNPAVPNWLSAFIARLLEKEPDRRFQSAAEVAHVLKGYLAHLEQPETVAPPALPASTAHVPRTSQRWPRRRVGAAAALICLLFLLGGIAAGAWWDRPAALDAPLPLPDVVAQGVPKAPCPRPAGQCAQCHQPAEPPPMLANPPLDFKDVPPQPVAADAQPPRPAGKPWLALMLIVGTVLLLAFIGAVVGSLWLRARQRAAGGPAQARWRQVAVAACLAAVVIASLGGWGAARLWRGPAENGPSSSGPCDVWSVAIAPDGWALAAGAGWYDGRPGEIGVWDLETLQPLQRFHEPGGIAAVAFSPDGKLLISSGWDCQVRVRDWAAGQVLAVLPTQAPGRVAVSPRGDFFAVVTEAGIAQLYDLATFQLKATLQSNVPRLHCVTFSADGKRLYAGGGEWKAGGRNLAVGWDVASLEPVVKFVGHHNTILGIAASPVDKIVATASVDKTVRLWDAESGALLKTLRGHRNGAEGISFAADGKLLSTGFDGMVCFWDPQQRSQTAQLAALPRDARSAQWTHDGQRLIVGGTQKTLKVFDSAGLTELATLWRSGEPTAMDELADGQANRSLGTRWLPFWFGSAALMLAAGLGFYLWRRQGSAATPPAPAESPTGSLTLTCPGCAKRLRVAAHFAGKKARCPSCRQPVSVPEPNHADGTPTARETC